MKLMTLSLSIILMFISPIYAQKASLQVKLLDSSFASPSDFIFEVEIRNDSFPTYWIQDTALLRARLDYPSSDLLHIILEKKVDNEFKSYERIKLYSGDSFLLDSCIRFCCKCVFISRGQALKLDLPLLSNYILEKGQYRIEVVLGPPLQSCDYCDEMKLGELYVDYYFRVP